MNLGHQGWAFAMVTRHSFRNDGSKTEQGTYELPLLQRHSLPDPDFYV